MNRINARVWKSQSEKFTDYAEAKLDLMQFLPLTEREKIDMLVEGVRDTLCTLVLDTRINSLPEFIDHVWKITENSVHF